jgi:hypothetical protein
VWSQLLWLVLIGNHCWAPAYANVGTQCMCMWCGVWVWVGEGLYAVC